MATNAARKQAREAKPASALADADHDWGADVPEVQVLTDAEWWKMYASAVRDELGLSTEEFEAAFERGEYDEGDAHLKGIGLWMMKIPRPH